MKKLLLVVVALAAIAFSSCERKNIEPDIIGSGIIHQDQKGYYVLVDDYVRWPITSVTAPKPTVKQHRRAEDIAPVEGVLVTVFASDNCDGVQAVLGEQNVTQIEDLYYYEYNHRMIIGCVIAFFLSFLIAVIIRPFLR